MVKLVKKHAFLLLILIIAFAVRLYSFLPVNIIVGFDQARDFFDAVKIVEGDLRIIGPTAGNNPNLHHGVLYLYYLAIPIFLFGKSPIILAIWNSFVNALSVVIIFFLSYALFKNKKVGYIASILTSFSFYYISFSSWLSNPTVTLFTVPLFFYGIWKYFEKKSWGLPLTFLALGLSIQFELFFLYLIPVGLVAWIILNPQRPTLKNLILSILILCASLSTMIATEIKFKFAGINSLISAGNNVGGVDQKIDFLKTKAFLLDIYPDNNKLLIIIGILAISYLFYEGFINKQYLKRNLFIILWFASPLFMLFLGIHNAPWFLIGRPAATIIISAYLLSKLKYTYLSYSFILLIIVLNLTNQKELLEPDKSADLGQQLAVIDYTYQSSENEKFAINTVTNPLYINLVWAYSYDWYAKAKYGYLPSFSGGKQIPPYNVLPESIGEEKIFYLIIDTTPRIPEIHKKYARDWATKLGKKIEQKEFDGILIEKYIVK